MWLRHPSCWDLKKCHVKITGAFNVLECSDEWGSIWVAHDHPCKGDRLISSSQKQEDIFLQLRKKVTEWSKTDVNLHWETRGGDLGVTGGTVPQKFEVGTAHASVPPIFWEVVLSDARESTNRVKKSVIKEFFSEIVVFLVRKGWYRGHIRHLT